MLANVTNDTMDCHEHLKNKAITRCDQRLDPSIIIKDEVDHRFCADSVFSRVLQRRIFLKNSSMSLRDLQSLRRSSRRTTDSDNFESYQELYQEIIDTFGLLDYQIMPLTCDPLAQFKTVNAAGKEKLPRPPLQKLIPALRSDISTLSETLRRYMCTYLHPHNVLQQSKESLKQRFRVIRASQNLYAEHSIMLAPQDDAFFFRDCKVCAIYDPEIIRFCRDLHCILLKIFHAQRVKPPSCRFFTPMPEMSDGEVSDD
ncbi:hypothetical protein NDA14_007699 [Ustilago hordei]|nr:hypothetical protein NDA14_007699 [Ustilago hordei]